MKQHHQKIKRYKSSFNSKAEKGLLLRRILGFIVLLAILFLAGWVLAKPGLDMGVKLWYQLKGESSSSSPKPAQPAQSVPIVSQGAASSIASSSASQADTVAAPSGSSAGSWAYVALSSASTPEAAAELARSLKSEGFTCAVLELKDARGFVYYNSAVPQAQGSLSSGAIDAAAIAKAFTDNGIVPIASISAFKDANAPRIDKNIAVTYNGQKEFLWLNNKAEMGGVPWLNPYSEGAVGYISDVLGEVLAAGFKEVIISGVQFPDGYGLELAGYSEGADTRSKDAVLKDCVAKWQAQCTSAAATCWFEYPSVPSLGDGDQTTILSPFTFGATHLLLDYADSVIKTEESQALDPLLFDAAIAKASSAGTVLAMRVSGAQLTGDALTSAAAAAKAAGFVSFASK